MRISDWSSDVCSSDLNREGILMAVGERQPFLPIVLKPSIEAERPCPAPGLLDQLDRAIRPGKIEVGDPDKGAAGRKRQAGSPPDATAGSCHKRRLIRKFRQIGRKACRERVGE